MSMLGGVFFLFISVHFVLDHIWDERTRSLEWLLRVSLLTGGSYFVFEHIPITQGISIYIVAWLTYLTLRLFGNSLSIEAGIPMEVDQGLLIMPADHHTVPISIVFACTAALSILLFSYAALVTKMNRAEWEPWAMKEMKRLKGRGSFLARSKVHGLRNLLRMADTQRKTRAIVIVVLLIFFTNIFRNVGVIAMVYDGHMSFDLAHGFYAKALSLVMMLFLTWVLFEHLPELQEDLMGLVDLTKRVKKGMIVNGRLDLRYVAAPVKEGD
jgi:exosortase/archaeosortase family protein